jgi:Pyridoxamine 5'-phosphate oxidase
MRQEDVMHVLHDPLAQELMRSEIPARLAYTGSDGFPRVVPVGFLWNGALFVIGTAPIALKVRALARNPKVALTIETNTWLPHVLLVRGTASIEVVDGVAPEYLDASRKYIPAEQWVAFEAQARTLYKQQARITIVPEWAELLDFETRTPRFLTELAAGAGSRG